MAIPALVSCGFFGLKKSDPRNVQIAVSFQAEKILNGLRVEKSSPVKICTFISRDKTWKPNTVDRGGRCVDPQNSKVAFYWKMLLPGDVIDFRHVQPAVEGEASVFALAEFRNVKLSRSLRWVDVVTDRSHIVQFELVDFRIVNVSAEKASLAKIDHFISDHRVQKYLDGE